MAIIYIDKYQYEIQEQKKFRYSMPVYTGQFGALTLPIIVWAAQTLCSKNGIPRGSCLNVRIFLRCVVLYNSK
jgi:hypothetical protein